MGTIVGFGASQCLRLVTNVVLARLLFPEAFGLMALIFMVLAALQMLSDVGIGTSLITSSRASDPRFRSTAWTLGLIRGTCLWLGATALSYPASVIYDHRLLYLLPVAGTTCLVNAFSSTSIHMLVRQLRTREVIVLDLLAAGAGAATMVIWASVSASIWSLVAGAIVSAITRSMGSWFIVAGYRDRLGWDWHAAEELVRIGKWIAISSVVGLIATQFDRMFLGRALSLEAFGVYAIASSFVNMPRDLVSRLTEIVQMPLLSESQQASRQYIETTVIKTRTLLLTLSIIVSLCIGLGGDVFFRLLYDERYYGAAALSQWLAVHLAIALLSTTADRALLAVHNPRALTFSNILRLSVTVPACLVGYSVFELRGFILGLIVGSISGHAAIQLALARAQIRIVAQDLKYILTLSGLLLVPLVLSNWINWHVSQASINVVPLLALVVVLSAVVVIRWQDVRLIMTEIKSYRVNDS